MPRRQLLLAAGVSTWLAAAAAAGQTPAEGLPPALRTHLAEEELGIVTSIRGLPLGVREALQTLFGTPSLDIAEPGAEFQATDAAGDSRLPARRLVAAGCSMDHCVVYYELGGAARAWRVAVFHWTPGATRFEWGGAAPGGLAAIADVRRAILSGKVRRPVTSW
jgi:hypothetical protein